MRAKTQKTLDPTFFILSKELSRPSFNTKRRLVELRTLAFNLYTEAEFGPRFFRLFELTSPIIGGGDIGDFVKYSGKQRRLDDNDEGGGGGGGGGESEGGKMEFLFWKRLGFTLDHDPSWDFKRYVEPVEEIERASILCKKILASRQEPSWQTPIKVVPFWKKESNSYERNDASPRNRCWDGSILAFDSILYFLDTHPQEANAIISSRVRDTDLAMGRCYRWVVASVEVSRIVALLFHVIATRPQSQRMPSQPDGEAFRTFYVDYRPPFDQGRQSPQYPMRPFWDLLLEKNAFFRIFSATFMLFDHLFTARGALEHEMPMVLDETSLILEDGLLRAGKISELEYAIASLIINSRELLTEIEIIKEEFEIQSSPKKEKGPPLFL